MYDGHGTHPQGRALPPLVLTEFPKRNFGHTIPPSRNPEVLEYEFPLKRPPDVGESGQLGKHLVRGMVRSQLSKSSHSFLTLVESSSLAHAYFHPGGITVFLGFGRFCLLAVLERGSHHHPNPNW